METVFVFQKRITQLEYFLCTISCVSSVRFPLTRVRDSTLGGRTVTKVCKPLRTDYGDESKPIENR